MNQACCCHHHFCDCRVRQRITQIDREIENLKREREGLRKIVMPFGQPIWPTPVPSQPIPFLPHPICPSRSIQIGDVLDKIKRPRH